MPDPLENNSSIKKNTSVRATLRLGLLIRGPRQRLHSTWQRESTLQGTRVWTRAISTSFRATEAPAGAQPPAASPGSPSAQPGERKGNGPLPAASWGRGSRGKGPGAQNICKALVKPSRGILRGTVPAGLWAQGTRYHRVPPGGRRACGSRERGSAGARGGAGSSARESSSAPGGRDRGSPAPSSAPRSLTASRLPRDLSFICYNLK